MFDRLIVTMPPSHSMATINKHVHEHRAPTDESVRLLAEMEAKARERIVQSVHVGNTTFECVVHVERAPVDESIRLLAIFSLNGKKLTAEHIERSYEFEPRKAFVALRDAIATKIASEMLQSAMLPALDRLNCRV